MRLIAFAFVFLVLAASASLAGGLEITEMRASIEYSRPYIYDMPYTEVSDKDKANKIVFSPVVNGSRLNVDVLPGSNITFTLFVENTLEANGPEIRGIFAAITLEEINDWADLFAETSEFQLYPGENERIDLKFEIPLDVEERVYDVSIEVEGRAQNRTPYDAVANLELEMKKERQDIRITKFMLDPWILSCNRMANLTVQIRNLGARSEDVVALEFKSAAIGVNSVDKDIFLDTFESSEEESSHTKTLIIELPPFFRAGKYPILVNLYWKNFILFDRKTADLVVMDCGASAEPEPEQEKEPEKKKTEMKAAQQEEEKSAQREEEKAPEQLTTSVEKSFLKNSHLFIVILVNGFIIFVLSILIIVAYLRSLK